MADKPRPLRHVTVTKEHITLFVRVHTKVAVIQTMFQRNRSTYTKTVAEGRSVLVQELYTIDTVLYHICKYGLKKQK